MENKELVNFIQEQLRGGMSKEDIKKSLLGVGWTELDIEKALLVIGSLPGLDQDIDKVAPTDTIAIDNTKFVHSAGSVAETIASKAVSLRKVPILVIFLGMIALLGGGVFAYLKFSPSPEKVIGKMLEKVGEIKSFSYSGEIEIEATTDSLNIPAIPISKKEKESDVKMDMLASILSTFKDLAVKDAGSGSTDNSESKGVYNLTFEGNLDSFDKENPKFTSLIKVVMDNPSLFGVLEETSKPSFSFESRFVDNVFYMKMQGDDLKTGPLTNSMETSWIRIDPNEIEQEMEGLGIVSEETKKMDEQEEEYLRKLEQVEQAFLKYKIFNVAEKLKSEKVNNHTCYHYLVVLDKEEIKKLYIELADIFRSLETTELTEEEWAKAEELFDKEIEKAKLTDIDVWIGKKDYMLYKIAFGDVIKASDHVKSGKYSVFCIFDKFNEPFDVQVPSPTSSIQEILEQMFGSMHMSL